VSASKPLSNQLPGEAKAGIGHSLVQLMGLHAGLRIHKLLPAQVVQYNRTTNLATIQPMIMALDTNDTPQERQALASVPVLSLGGGGFTVNFPLKENDFGWMLAADRDISTFLQGNTQAPPNSMRKHRFEDSWFVPDVLRQYVINEADAANMVITSLDGTLRISLGAGVITLTAPTGVKVVTPLAEFTQDVQIDGNATITGMTTVNGGFTATGGTGSEVCSLPASTTIGGIVVANHGHEQDGTSGRTAGGMIS
jgi:hypothetical protein